MVKRPGADRYEPISWDDAFAPAAELDRVDDPDNAFRLLHVGANEQQAAFAYQLFVRQFGTNNLLTART